LFIPHRNRRYIRNWKDFNYAAALENREQVIEDYKKSRASITEDSNDVFSLLKQQLRQQLQQQLQRNQNRDINEIVKEVMADTSYIPHGAGIHHPIDGYLLMKRLSVEWDRVKISLETLREDTSC